MKPIKLLLTLALTSVFVLTACTKKASDEIDFGKITNDVYQNEFFGFSVTLPPEWSVQDDAATQEIKELGEEMLVGDDKKMQAATKAAALNTVYLLTAFEHPLGSPVEFNPSFMSIAERVRNVPGIKEGKDYLFHVKKFLEASQMEIAFPKEIYTEEIDGVSFDVMELEMAMMGSVVTQRYYATIKKEYALSFVLSFASDENEENAKNILQTVRFN